jgi:hypothetical protein
MIFKNPLSSVVSGGAAHFLADQVGAVDGMIFKNPLPSVVAGGAAHYLADQVGAVDGMIFKNPLPSVVAGGAAHFLGKFKPDSQIDSKKEKKIYATGKQNWQC